jgi:hypothetical protein
VVLGLFVLAQLAFLVLSNLIGLYQDAQPHVPAEIGAVAERVIPGYTSQGGHGWKIPDELSTALRRWAQLTGQDQNWSLFAPGVAKVTGFPALLLAWDEAPNSAAAIAFPLALLNARDPIQAVAMVNLLDVRPDHLQPAIARVAAPVLADFAAARPMEVVAVELARSEVWPAPLPRTDLFLSDNEPRDPNHFLRIGLFRFRRYESNLILYLNRSDDESVGEATERWARSIRDHVADNFDQLQAYLKWRLSVYRQRHPERPAPRQVILVERTYRILPPDDPSGARLDGPRTLPLVRWQPEARWEPTYRSLERYNPVTQTFEPILR